MNRLTLKQKLGYGAAAAGDSITYVLINTFIVFFLTTAAGIKPAAAGTLTVIGTVWNAFFNPLIGYISDHTSTKWGRRRPYILGFCLPLFLSVVLIFTVPGFSYPIKIIYYGLLIIAFWTSYTGFFVPYYALGAQYTSDFEERTYLRSFASFFNTLGTTISMALPVSLVNAIENCGIKTSAAWTITAAVIAFIASCTIIITVISSKDKDICRPPYTNSEAKGIKEMFNEYLQVLKLQPLRWLLMCSLFYLTAYSVFTSDLVYFLTYNMAFSEHSISIAMLFRCFICVILIVPIVKLSCLTDRKTALLIIVVTGCIGCILLRFVNLNNILMTVLLILFSVLITSSYWQVVPSMFYDVCDYDQHATGCRREGSVLAVQGLVESIASGIGTQVLGLILQFGDFNGLSDIQSERTMSWILNCTTWIPVVFMSLAIFALIKYPITRKSLEQAHQEDISGHL